VTVSETSQPLLSPYSDYFQFGATISISQRLAALGNWSIKHCPFQSLNTGKCGPVPVKVPEPSPLVSAMP